MYYMYIFYVKREKNKMVVFFISEYFVHSRFLFLAQLCNTKNKYVNNRNDALWFWYWSKTKKCGISTSFEEGWEIVDNTYPNLMIFCGGIAFAFPKMATVKSDFSVVKWKNNKFCSHLTNFSLEGILHCKQFEKLSEIPLPPKRK